MKREFIFIAVTGLLCFLGFELFFQRQPSDIQDNFRAAAIMPSKEDRFWNEMWLSLNKEAERKHLRLSEYPYDFGNSQQNVEKELEKVILSEPDGIILCSNQYTSEKIQHLLTEAKSQGIKILLCDSDAPPEMRDYFVGVDNAAAGRAAARQIMNNGNFSGVLIFAESDAKVSIASQARLEAFRKEMTENGLDSMIEEVQLPETGEEHFDEIQLTLRKGDGENKAIVSFNASSTLVLAQCIQRLKLHDVFYLLGFSESEEAFEYADKGVIDLLYVQNIQQMGQFAVDYLDETLRGTNPDTDSAFIEMTVYQGQED